jgi:hypothetical protein
MYRVTSIIIVLALLIPAINCTSATQRAPILVAQTGLAVARSIGELSAAVKQLQQASILPAAAALRLQETLLAINTKLEPLPGILRTIDAAQTAGDAAQTDVDRAIAVLQVVSADISTVLVGVPVAETTKVLIDLVRTAQTTVSTVLVEIARLKQ